MTLQRQAEQAYAEGRFAQASEGFRQLADKMPTDADVRYRLANSLVRQGLNQAAIDAYRETLIRDPNHARAWHNLIIVQTQEVLLTTQEMQGYLSSQDPQGRLIMERAERLTRAVSEYAVEDGRK